MMNKKTVATFLMGVLLLAIPSNSRALEPQTENILTGVFFLAATTGVLAVFYPTIKRWWDKPQKKGEENLATVSVIGFLAAMAFVGGSASYNCFKKAAE